MLPKTGWFDETGCFMRLSIFMGHFWDIGCRTQFSYTGHSNRPLANQLILKHAKVTHVAADCIYSVQLYTSENIPEMHLMYIAYMIYSGYNCHVCYFI